MTVYILLLLVIIAGKIFSNKRIVLWDGYVVNGRKAYICLSFFVIWFLMAFRASSIGTDTLAYTKYYEDIAGQNSLSDAVSLEYISGDVFKGISYMIGFVSQAPQFYIFWTGTIISIGMAVYIYRTSHDPAFSTFLFLTLNLFFISMNTARQWVAIAIALNALYILYKNSKSIWGWLLLGLAFGIHNTIFLFFPAVILSLLVKRYGLNKKSFFVMLVMLAPLLGLFFIDIEDLLFSYFPHYMMYVNIEYEDGLIGDTGNGKIIIEYIFFLGILFLLFFKSRKKGITDDFVKALIPGAVFCVVLGIMLSKNNMANRLLIPYQCLFLSIIPYTLSQYKGITRLVLHMVVCTGVIFSYFLWMNGNLGDIIPFQFGF